MPSISKIRFTNVVYEDGNKRYNDETFYMDGHNTAIVLENGGGKTVLIQTALQAVIPHTDLGDRKIRDTLQLEESPAHIAIEWLLNDQPRRYLVTCVTLFMTKNGLDSYRYVYEYGEHDDHALVHIPFVRDTGTGKRPADRGEMQDYYHYMTQNYIHAKTFPTIKAFRQFIEQQYQIAAKEWESVVHINSSEGGVEAFFDACRQTSQLFDRLLIPTVENAISGHRGDKRDFADTFEQHRESFHMYKQLKEKISENERIQHEMEVYADTFRRLHNEQMKYEQEKRKAKGMTETVRQQLRQYESEQEQLADKREQWHKRDTRYRIRLASHEIRYEEAVLAEWQQQLREAEEELDAAEQRAEQAQRAYVSLIWTGHLHEYKQEAERKTALSKQLEQLDREPELDEIEAALEDNHREWNGYYRERIDRAEKRKRELAFERKPLQDERDLLIHRLRTVESEQRQAEQQANRSQGQVERLESDMERIRRQLLVHPEQERIEEEVERWAARSQELDEQIIDWRKEEKKIRHERHKQAEEQQRLQNDAAETDKRISQLDTELAHVRQAEEEVKRELSALKPAWGQIESVYFRQASILGQLNDTVDRLELEREEELRHERQTHRYVDDYDEQDLFFADANLARHIERWRNQFSYLRTGIEYVREAGSDADDMYPYWAVTLVTTEADKPALIDKLAAISDRLQYPVDVLDTSEAREAMQGDMVPAGWVVPRHWLDNTDPDRFRSWKENVRKQAQAAREERLHKEAERERWVRGRQALQAFLERHPHEQWQSFTDERNEWLRERARLAELMRELNGRIQQQDEQLELLRQQIESAQEEKSGLDSKLDKARDYLQQKHDCEQLMRELDRFQREAGEKARELRRLQQSDERLTERIEQLLAEEREQEWEVRQLRAEPKYEQVKHTDPIVTGKSRIALEEEEKKLEFRLRKLSQSRTELQAKLDHAVDKMNTHRKAIEQMREQYGSEYEPSSAMEYPRDGEDQVKERLNEMKKARVDRQQARDVRDRVRSECDRKSGVVASKQNAFAQEFPGEEPVQFDDPPQVVVQELREQKRLLEQDDRYLHGESSRVEKQLQQLQTVYNRLDKADGSHHFLADAVDVLPLTETEQNEFTYHRSRAVDQCLQRLERQFEAVKRERAAVDASKEKFKQFCRTHISDVKMREMAIQGVDRKRTWNEVQEFRHHLHARVQSAIRYAETHIRTHDQQLEQFIEYLHTHLETVAHELAVIPKKTRVKVGDAWKQIFNFTIPEWEAEYGKEQLREHIQWILAQLETDRYRDEQGEEDTVKVRRDIETWLQSKQLLRVVMNHQAMKVTCRKVTNDNEVTTRSYSWEQSNHWSGGEKWSKNMTLYLGILNYITEKYHHVRPDMERHRVVIMDNPFGRASSDHVLSPVFFIAEQLGFQLIALTAHAEGKFLRDYFPVMYSCRLRTASEPGKMIMEKEQWVRHAYFRDHDPHAMERLGDVEQVELF